MSSSSEGSTKKGAERPMLNKASVSPTPQHGFDGIPSEGVDHSDTVDRGYTTNDRRDMGRMGKVQELKRSFHGLSALSITVILQGTWEVLLTATTQGLTSGGLAGLSWSYVWTFFGLGFVMISLAEMASMAPTSGGQYHWVSEFAPPKYQKVLSYVTGWQASLSWQAGTASGPFLIGTIIQALLTVNDPNYSPTNWQGTLFIIAVTGLIFVANVWGSRIIPFTQDLMLVIHVIAFIAVTVVLWAKSPHNSAQAVFTQFSNEGGWDSMGLTVMVGQISAIYGLICSDATAHVSEEITDAGLTVPRAMVWSYILNASLGLVFLIAFLFSITSIDDALNHPSGYPFLYVFQQTVSLAGVNALTAIVIILITAGSISFTLATSRQVWAFARDGGLPFSKWIGHVHSGLHIPANAVGLTCAITILLSLINVGSDVAFNAIISLNIVSLMFTYCISIGCVLHRRIYHPELLPLCRWTLGRWGIPVNIIGLVYSFFAFFWSFWPNTTPVDATTFNWAVVMFLAVIIGSLASYFTKGREAFQGPVVLVEGWHVD